MARWSSRDIRQTVVGAATLAAAPFLGFMAAAAFDNRDATSIVAYAVASIAFTVLVTRLFRYTWEVSCLLILGCLLVDAAALFYVIGQAAS